MTITTTNDDATHHQGIGNNGLLKTSSSYKQDLKMMLSRGYETMNANSYIGKYGNASERKLLYYSASFTHDSTLPRVIPNKAHQFHPNTMHQDKNHEPIEFYDFLQVNTESNRSEVIDMNTRKDEEEVDQMEAIRQEQTKEAGAPFIDFFSG